MYIMFTGVVGGVEEVMMKFTQVLFGLCLQVDIWQQIVNWWLFDDNIWLVRSHQILQLHLNVCAVVVVVVVLIVMGRVNMTLV